MEREELRVASGRHELVRARMCERPAHDDSERATDGEPGEAEPQIAPADHAVVACEQPVDHFCGKAEKGHAQLLPAGRAGKRAFASALSSASQRA